MSRGGRRGRVRGRTGQGLFSAEMAGATSVGAARLAYAVLNRYPPGGIATWSRTNHRGEKVTLLEGPAVVVGSIVGALAHAGLRSATGQATRRATAAMAVAGAGAAAFGAYDDLAGSGDRRGFGGHLDALRHGEVTTGAVKLGGIGVVGILSAALAGGAPADVAINAGLVAGGANLLNLFDLRPGRAIKVAVASGALIAAGRPRGAGGANVATPSAAVPLPPWAAAPPAPHPASAVPLAPLAAAAALLPEDLGERAMLGDCGANALGAMLGAAAAGMPRPARIALLAGIVGLTAASEKVSFSKVIERTPALRRLDMLGRRPAAPVPRGLIPAQRGDPMRSAGAGTTARSAENTDTPPPEQ
jgi:UDP-GlcNAc:undecaprenyl-phosphate/decaprenyl-phosphate GlcNAc-1-phosphate transferase